MQQIPSRNGDIRPTIIPKPGHKLVGNDYSSQEPRILAYVSQDPVLLETFEKERDVYSVLISTARGLSYEECTKEACHAREEEWEARGKIGPKPVNYRNQGKVLQLALSYGLGASALSDKLEIPLEEAEQLMKDFKQNLSGVFEYEARLKEFARKTGYVETLGGRKRRFPDYALPEFTITGAQGQPVPEVLKQQIANKFKYVWKYNERKELVTQLEMQHQVNIIDNNMTRNEDATQILNSVIQGGQHCPYLFYLSNQ